MAKKVYNHNDYYGYINKIQSMALSNPEWFWSDSADAVEARQWLHDNNAGAIIDEIYDNTPESIREKIPYKKLTVNKAQGVYDQGIRDASNEASKYVAGALATSATLPYAISAFPSIASEVAATAKFLATPAGKTAMSKLASDMVVSTAVGEAVNESARASGYNSFGDLAAQSVGVDPETKGYKYISGAADFLNPGYFIGGAAANRAWNATRLGAIESSNLAAEAIERNKMLRDLVDNTKQRLSNTFGNLKSSIVKRVNRAKDGVTSTEVPETVLRPEAAPEQPFFNGYPEWVGSSVREPENVVRELPSLNTESSLPNETRRILETATIPESMPVETNPVSITTESSNWTPKEPLSYMNRTVLERNGLRRYDIDNLRQMGYTPEQLQEFDYLSIPGMRPNNRANLIDSRLRESGVYPAARSRADFTREALANQPVYHYPDNAFALHLPGNHVVSPGQPITRAEIDSAIRQGIIPEDFDISILRPATPESIDLYYSYYPLATGNFRIRPTNFNHTWLEGTKSIFDKALLEEARDLNNSLSTLSEEEFKAIAPAIKNRVTQLRDRVVASGGTPSLEEARGMIKQELTNLYRDEYNKLYKVELPNSTNIQDKVHTIATNSRPIFDNELDMLDVIFKDGEAAGNWSRSNPAISSSPYTIENVPLEFSTNTDGSLWGYIMEPDKIVGSYSGFHAFGRDIGPLRRLRNTLFEDTTTHGRLAYEANKSMDSTKLFNRQAADAAKQGKGVLLFDGLKDISRTNNKYNYVHTNDCAGTIFNPYRDVRGTLEDLSTKKVADNLDGFSRVLKYTDPRIFKAFGGTPEFKAVIQRPGGEPQYIDLPYNAIKGADGKTDYVFDFFNTDAAGNHTSEAWKILDDFDKEVLVKKTTGQPVSNYRLGMLYPLTGFRSFKHGGIVKRK